MSIFDRSRIVYKSGESEAGAAKGQPGERVGGRMDGGGGETVTCSYTRTVAYIFKQIP